MRRSPLARGGRGGDAVPARNLGNTYSVGDELSGRGGAVGEGDCAKCGKVVKESQTGIECDVCGAWSHSGCVGLGKKDYEYFKQAGNVALWVCDACKLVVKGAGEKIRNLELENEKLKDENKKLYDKMDEILTRMRTLKEDIKREVKEEIMEEIRGEVKEEEERKKRECNVIIHGLMETQEEDRIVCEKIIKDELGLRNIEMGEVMRLNRGRSGEEEGIRRPPVPVLVKFRTPGQKWAVIGKAKNLRNARDERYRRTMIVPDMTVKEREKDKRLREELRRRREEGERGIYINRGEIKRRDAE